ncbi:pheromone A receptor-domain-containing protein [Vararia minispora EC-137]|uniref:Pheromone A receptor-domain-containing protein n=1 Tax=Vararia minispora EC-137 TaxID=1314806 RepID=A0ACB8QX39_9AGAM|nr:pheromone A receptor-domain-containing protein [Vararia minispora EC-137]
MAADPIFPLYTVFSLLGSVLVLLVLTTNFVHQSWNIGVSFLCFWLFCELLTAGINTIIWRDNADLKFYVYCDIISHLHMVTFIVKPACTLLITRRLYKIASLRSVLPPTRREKIVDSAVEWSIGLGLPLLVAGVFYYIVQNARFAILEGSGCGNTIEVSGVSVIAINSWLIILPCTSVFFYCPKIILVLYRLSRETNNFLQSGISVSRPSYLRLFALASVDIVLTFPSGVANIIVDIKSRSPEGAFQFYSGWASTHSDWAPISYTYKELQNMGGWSLLNYDLNRWCSVILSLVIFALFGLTAEARATYRRGFYAICKPFGLRPPPNPQNLGVSELTHDPLHFSKGTEDETCPSIVVCVVKDDESFPDLERRLVAEEIS